MCSRRWLTIFCTVESKSSCTTLKVLETDNSCQLQHILKLQKSQAIILQTLILILTLKNLWGMEQHIWQKLETLPQYSTGWEMNWHLWLFRISSLGIWRISPLIVVINLLEACSFQSMQIILVRCNLPMQHVTSWPLQNKLIKYGNKEL